MKAITEGTEAQQIDKGLSLVMCQILAIKICQFLEFLRIDCMLSCSFVQPYKSY